MRQRVGEAQAEKYVHPHERPAVGFLDGADDLAACFALAQARDDALRGGRLVAMRFVEDDELGLDPRQVFVTGTVKF